MNCPKCDEPMDIKAMLFEPLIVIFSDKCLMIYQCPMCKNIEVEVSDG